MDALRRTLSHIQPFVFALALLLLALLLRSQWASLRSYDWTLRPLWLVPSSAAIVGGWLLEIAMWRGLLARLDAQAFPMYDAARIWFASALVRYVPGNIWQPLTLTTRCRARGIRPEATIASLTLYHVVHILAVVPIAILYVAAFGHDEATSRWVGAIPVPTLAMAALPVVAFIVRPSLLVRLVNPMLVAAGRPPLVSTLTTTALLTAMAVSLAAWGCFAAGFVFLAAAVLPAGTVGAGSLPHLMAAYPLAFAAGFVSLLTPSGLIVREGVLYALLAPSLGTAGAMVAAVAMRIWELALDAVAGVASTLSLRWTEERR